MCLQRNELYISMRMARLTSATCTFIIFIDSWPCEALSGHVRLYANLFFMVDTVNQRNLIFYLSLTGLSSGYFTADSERGRCEYL